eukprot:COSAG01_NODE_2741_length_7157_cov_10.590677_10_plen_159_part_01
MSGNPRVLQNPLGGYAVLRFCGNDLPQQVLNCGRPDTRPSPIVSEVASSAAGELAIIPGLTLGGGTLPVLLEKLQILLRREDDVLPSPTAQVLNLVRRTAHPERGFASRASNVVLRSCTRACVRACVRGCVVTHLVLRFVLGVEWQCATRHDEELHPRR